MKLPIKIALSENFLAAETRCGYFVPEKQKKIWAVQLDLLHKLLTVCEKNNIEVMAFGGTLLGAVRHKGFIPWDDDIDVALTRENYEKLCVIAAREFESPYFFQTAMSDPKCFFPAARLRNSRTTAAIVGQETIEYNNGIYIDVFALDGMPDGKIRTVAQNFLIRFLGSVLNLYYVRPGQVRGIKCLVKRMARPIARLFKYDVLFRYYKRVLMMYDSSSKNVGLLAHGKMFRTRYWLKKLETKNLMLMDFENLKIPVPRAWDAILRRTYGKYMEFPPENQRGTWHQGQIFFDPELSYKDYFKS